MFGGTAEGRELVEWLSGLDACDVVSCTATEYGGQLVEGLARVTALVGPLDAKAKERLVAEHDFACIVDATHPYATHVTGSIAALAGASGLPLVRLARDAEAHGAFTLVDDVEGAAAVAASSAGNVLLATGAKDLGAFVAAMPDYAKRLYARVLPVEASIVKAHDLGIPTSHIIAMQGPFTVDMNVATMRQFDIRTMVTKDSGATGGFQEKIDAAAACGAKLVVIRRPEESGGLSFAEAQAQLAQLLGVEDVPQAAKPQALPREGSLPEREGRHGAAAQAGKTVYLVGIGLGDPDTMTVEAQKAIARSDMLIGAARMLEPYAGRDCRKLALIRSDDIVAALRDEDYTCASVLFSGDVGFYSGATALAEKLGALVASADGPAGEGADRPVQEPGGGASAGRRGAGADIAVRAIPGISSAVCLCARLLTPWQDAHLVSAHGRECDPVAEVRAHAKTFMLTGGKTKARDVCALLAGAGLGEVDVHVGERLSYPDERIVHGTAAELAEQDFLDLAVMLVENPDAPKVEPGRLEA